MCKGPGTTADSQEKKPSLFNKLKLNKGTKDEKPQKEKKQKREKTAKKAVTFPGEAPVDEAKKESSIKNIFQKEKKKPRAEYQEEIDVLTAELAQTKDDLAATKRQLAQSQSKFNELRRWALNPPVM